MTKIDKKLQEISERLRFITDYKHIGMMDKMKIEFLTEIISSAEKLKKIYRKGMK